jgi:hypothetical protein
MLTCIGLIGALCALGVWPGIGLAEERGSIQGVVQHEGKGIAEHRIMLIRFGSNQEVQRTSGQTDTQGRFIFEDLETGKDFKYTVGIRYNGRLYQSAPITLESGQHRTGVVVEVRQKAAQAAGTSTSPSTPRIVNHLMFITLRDDHLEVREVVNLRYTGSKPYTGAAVHTGHTTLSLYLPLPQGYYNLRDVQGLEAEYVHNNASGLYYTAPLKPGERRVVYTYALPFRDDMKVIFTDRTLPTAVFDVFVDDTYLVAASDLQFVGRIAATPHTFSRFRGTNLAARSRSWLQLTRRTAATPLLQVGTYSFILGIALLGIAIPCYRVWRGRAQQDHTEPITPAQLQELHATRVRLLRTIAHLDNQHEAGAIDEDTYQQQRQVYKKRLVELAEYLHYNQQRKEDSP